MGLDIAFSTKQALEAGLEIKLHHDDVTEKMDKQYDLLVKIYHNWENNGDTDFHFVDAEVNDDICVRANKWGDTYKPLTAWLKQHDIEWSEF